MSWGSKPNLGKSLKLDVMKVQTTSDIQLAKTLIKQRNCLEFIPPKPNELLQVIQVINTPFNEETDIPKVDNPNYLNAAILFKLNKENKKVEKDLASSLLVKFSHSIQEITKATYSQSKSLIEGGCDVVRNSKELFPNLLSPECLLQDYKTAPYIAISNCVNYLLKLNPELFSQNEHTKQACIYLASNSLVYNGFLKYLPNDDQFKQSFLETVEEQRISSLKNILNLQFNIKSLQNISKCLSQQNELEFLFKVISAFPQDKKHILIQNCEFSRRIKIPKEIIELLQIDEKVDVRYFKQLTMIDNEEVKDKLYQIVASLARSIPERSLSFFKLLPQETISAQKVLEYIGFEPLPPLTSHLYNLLSHLIKLYPKTVYHYDNNQNEKTPIDYCNENLEWD